jgi:hypothetical protein
MTMTVVSHSQIIRQKSTSVFGSGPEHIFFRQTDKQKEEEQEEQQVKH